jgi:hypothetical protein
MSAAGSTVVIAGSKEAKAAGCFQSNCATIEAPAFAPVLIARSAQEAEARLELPVLPSSFQSGLNATCVTLRESAQQAAARSAPFGVPPILDERAVTAQRADFKGEILVRIEGRCALGRKRSDAMNCGCVNGLRADIDRVFHSNLRRKGRGRMDLEICCNFYLYQYLEDTLKK